MITHASGEKLSARPMVAVGLEQFAGELWFFTSIDSPKVEEIRANPEVLLAYSEPKDQHYISIRGHAELVQDRAKIDQYWNEKVRAWFPDGKDDPRVALVQVTVESAEYWDAPASSWVYLYGYAKAAITGEPLKDVAENETVRFNQQRA